MFSISIFPTSTPSPVKAKLVRDVVVMVEVGHFFHNKLGISERRIKTITWPEVAKRLHQVQSSTRLCATRDLTEHDIILRVMRRDNYIIGMLNQGVLALHVPIPGLRGRVFFTQMLQWNIKACVHERRRMRGGVGGWGWVRFIIVCL